MRAKFHEEGEKRRVHTLKVSVMEAQLLLDRKTDPSGDDTAIQHKLPPDVDIVMMEIALNAYINENMSFVGRFMVFM